MAKRREWAFLPQQAAMRLRTAIKEQKTTRGALAERIGLRQCAVTAIINRRRAPSFGEVRAIADGLAISLAELFQCCNAPSEPDRAMALSADQGYALLERLKQQGRLGLDAGKRRRILIDVPDAEDDPVIDSICRAAACVAVTE